DAITISKPRNRDGSTGHVLAKRSVTFTEIRTSVHTGAFSFSADSHQELSLRLFISLKETTTPVGAAPRGE
ncbi:hypothetical protein ACPA1H_24490, partial [Ectopseudomonas chengduensis]